MITALMVRPDEHPTPTMLCDNSEYLDRAVSIDSDLMCSASVSRLDEGIAVIFCREAVFFGLRDNRRVKRRIIAGVFYIVAYENGKLMSLSDDDIVKYTAMFWEPEIFLDDEALDSWFDSLATP